MINIPSRFRKVFRDLYDCYAEAKNRSVSASAANVNSSSTDGAKYKPQRGVTLLDFVCDFEIVSKSVLNPVEKMFFIKHYVVGLGLEGVKLPPGERYLNKAVQSKAGRALVAQRLSPITEYFKD